MQKKGNAAPASQGASERFYPWIALGVLGATLVWGYWNSLAEAAIYWQGAQYSHGWLVPLFTAAVLWMRYEPISGFPQWQRLLGVGLLGMGLMARLACARIGLDVPDMWTFVPSVAGLVLLVGGWPMFRWAGPAVLLLIFMFPLPWTLERALLSPLQRLATGASTYALQTLGMGAYNEGNVIWLQDLPMGVVEACSGLRMTTIFLALSAAIVLMAHRTWWENLIILLSAVPIALTVNVIRITVTGILYLVATPEFADVVFHKWLAPYVMTLLALALLWLELAILSHLFYEVESDDSTAMWGHAG
jgi:exosortase